MNEIIQGLTLPFLGTALGAACVFFLKNELSIRVQQILSGFAAGVMTAASVWSLLIPAIEQSSALGKLAFLPAVIGFLAGMIFLLITEAVSSRLQSEGKSLLFLAVTLHNIPEGMAVGVVCADLLYSENDIGSAAAAALILGIAIQNFPEGAIISMPLKAKGMPRAKAFLCGAVSGAAEPLGAALTILAAGFIVPLMPYLLSFAAGAMIYVVTEELIPEMSDGKNSFFGVLSYAAGFAVMMMLDVMLG